MREIKFRWFQYGFMRYEFDGWSEDIGINEAIKLASSEYSAVIMQFTGLHDKNGKEIYEGDILRLHYSENEPVDGIVFWASANKHPTDGVYGMETAGWVLDKYALEGKECNKCWYHLSVQAIREVIGNVHENPQLLTATPNPLAGEI